MKQTFKPKFTTILFYFLFYSDLQITCVKDISDLKELLGPDVQLPSDYGGEGLSQCEYNGKYFFKMLKKTLSKITVLSQIL